VFELKAKTKNKISFIHNIKDAIFARFATNQTNPTVPIIKKQEAPT